MGGRGRGCGLVIHGCPLIGSMVSCGCRHSLVLGLPFYPLPVLVFLVFFEFASSSGYSSKRALLPDRGDPSGMPPSDSSQSSRSVGSSVSWACCAMVVVPLLLPSAVLPFWASLAFFFLFLCRSRCRACFSRCFCRRGCRCGCQGLMSDFIRFCRLHLFLGLGSRVCSLCRSFCRCCGFYSCCLLCR